MKIEDYLSSICIKDIILFILIFVICYLMIKLPGSNNNNKIDNNNNNKIDNFASTSSGISQIQSNVDTIFDNIYNIDVESMKNLGFLSKTLLTGSGYYIDNSDPAPSLTQSTGTLSLPTLPVENSLTLPGNTIFEGSLNIDGNVTLNGDLSVENGNVIFSSINSSNQQFEVFPKGMIMAFNTTNPIPPGWEKYDLIPPGVILLGSGMVSPNNLNTELYYAPVSYNAPQNFSLNETGGEISHTLTTNELPTHSHSTNVVTYGWRDNGDLSGLIGMTPTQSVSIYEMPTGTNNSISGTTSIPHNNMPPSTILNYIIKV